MALKGSLTHQADVKLHGGADHGNCKETGAVRRVAVNSHQTKKGNICVLNTLAVQGRALPSDDPT